MKHNKCLKLFSFKESSSRVTQLLQHMVSVICFVFSDCKWCSFSWRGRNKRATGGRQRAVLRSAGQYRHVGPHRCRPLYTSAHRVQTHTPLQRNCCNKQPLWALYFPSVFSLLEERVTRLHGQLQRHQQHLMASADPGTVDRKVLDDLYEDIHWLILVSGPCHP